MDDTVNTLKPPPRWYDMLVPREGYFVTPIIVGINVLVFLIMVLSGLGFLSFKVDDLVAWGGNYRLYTMDGQWWRMITCIFLHAGFVHVLMNMLCLIYVGIFLEPVLGKIGFALLYLFTGIAASAASLWWHAASVSVGASGAIFGMYGVALALLVWRIFPSVINKALFRSTILFVAVNLLIGSAIGGVDNSAHIGGLVSGLVAGLIMGSPLKRQRERVLREHR